MAIAEKMAAARAELDKASAVPTREEKIAAVNRAIPKDSKEHTVYCDFGEGWEVCAGVFAHEDGTGYVYNPCAGLTQYFDAADGGTDMANYVYGHFVAVAERCTIK